MSDSKTLSVKPIVHYPRVAQVGKTYLMTIDLEVEENFKWQYDEEEYPIYCTVDSRLFTSKPVGEPVVVLHRFGGSYGEARFLLTAKKQPSEGTIQVTLENKWGLSIATFELDKLRLISEIDSSSNFEDSSSSLTLDSVLSKVRQNQGKQKTERIFIPKNTVQDLFKIKAGITCPTCGSILNFTRSGNTEMILTENSRLELNSSLSNYRRFLEKLELILEERDYSHNNLIKSHAKINYTDLEIDPSVDSWIEELLEIFPSFPQYRLDNQEIQGEISRATRDILLPGLEPRSVTGPLIDLIFNQKYVADWIHQVFAPNNRHLFESLLEEICPAIQNYLQLLLQFTKQTIKNQKSKARVNGSLEDGVARVQFILVIMLGHRSKNVSLSLEKLSIAENVPFTLPRKTVVSPNHLQELLCSEIVLGNPKIGLDRELLIKLRQDVQKYPGRDEKQIIEQIITKLKNGIHEFIHFTCTGSASNFPSSDEDAQAISKLERKETCGWYPKLEPTHSVILLGSPGTGRSSVMLTGFTTFYDNVFALGATISFDSPEDEAMMKNLNEKYWVGEIPPPAAKGSRTTIKLSVEFPEKGYRRTNFVFTNIAGEVMAKSLTTEGSDPAVLKILKNAETIIFFFDISIEPSIRKKLTEGDDGTWAAVEEHYERVRRSRAPDTQSTAEVSQLQLLQKLIQDLRVQRGLKNLKNTYNFICVIPKTDLFTNDNTSNTRFFFSNFYEKLSQTDILVPSTHNTQKSSFSNMRSLGGTTVKFDKGVDPITRQKTIGEFISLQALESLRSIGNALGNEVTASVRSSLTGTLEVGLIQTLHHAFGDDRVYFLPVSSGQKSEPGSSFNQRLTEYTFILPIVLAVNSEHRTDGLENRVSRLNPNDSRM